MRSHSQAYLVKCLIRVLSPYQPCIPSTRRSVVVHIRRQAHMPLDAMKGAYHRVHRDAEQEGRQSIAHIYTGVHTDSFDQPALYLHMADTMKEGKFDKSV